MRPEHAGESFTILEFAVTNTIYWDKTQMQNDGATPSILAIGDSWFWYPFFGGSLIVSFGGSFHRPAIACL